VYYLASQLDQPKPTQFAPATGEATRILPGLPAVAGKPVHVGFAGGRLTSDAGIFASVGDRAAAGDLAIGWRLA
jgi:hypothetical protein